MKITNCIIVDDEPLAINIIKNYLDKLAGYEIVATCNSALEAFEILNRKRIDLMFLDIQMPELNGIEFIKSLEKKPEIILTTAFRAYAVESYELDVLDYLVKPISLQRLLKSIQKFQEKKGIENSNIQNNNSETDFLYVKEGKKNIKLILKDIHFIESMKDYLRIQLKDEKIIIKISMTTMEDMLPQNGFIRIHRSYIVPIEKIKAYSASQVEIDNKKLPIGNTYKSPVLKRLDFLSKG